MNYQSSITHEQLSAELVARDLCTRILGRRIVYDERITSTNDAAKQLAEAGEPEGALVIADEQTAGRGRFERTWFAPPRSSILMSLVLRPDLTPPQATRVTMAIALGACDAIRIETGLPTQIKWPNDILLKGTKCAGILVESGIVGDKLEYVIVGLGVNVNFSLREKIQVSSKGRNLNFENATTIADELGKPFPRIQLMHAILRSIENYYLRLRAGENLREEFASRLVTLHQEVTAQTPWGIEKGIAENIDDDGALMLRHTNGSLVRLVAAEVTISLREL